MLIYSNFLRVEYRTIHKEVTLVFPRHVKKGSFVNFHMQLISQILFICPQKLSVIQQTVVNSKREWTLFYEIDSCKERYTVISLVEAPGA